VRPSLLLDHPDIGTDLVDVLATKWADLSGHPPRSSLAEILEAGVEEQQAADLGFELRLETNRISASARHRNILVRGCPLSPAG
jgi:hypothetical protein